MPVCVDDAVYGCEGWVSPRGGGRGCRTIQMDHQGGWEKSVLPRPDGNSSPAFYRPPQATQETKQETSPALHTMLTPRNSRRWPHPSATYALAPQAGPSAALPHLPMATVAGTLPVSRAPREALAPAPSGSVCGVGGVMWVRDCLLWRPTRPFFTSHGRRPPRTTCAGRCARRCWRILSACSPPRHD